jgi:hypothetical protein
MISFCEAQGAFPLILYGICPIISGYLLYMASKNSGMIGKDVRPFTYFFAYSLIGAILTPLILKTIDNKIFEEIAKPYSNYYLLASYIIIVSFFASPLLKKLAAATFGEEVSKEIDDLMKVAPQIIKDNIESIKSPMQSDSISNMHDLLLNISSGKIKKSSDSGVNQDALSTSKLKRLITVGEDGGLGLTNIGRLYLSSKSHGT